MPNLEQYLEQGSVVSFLHRAGMAPQSIQHHRAFASNWGWDDGTSAYVTLWMHDIHDPHGIPKWSQSDPSLRDDLAGQRGSRAAELYSILVRYSGRPVRVILQKRKADRSKWRSGLSQARGLDPVAWYPLVEGDTVLLQRGSLPGRRDVAVDGQPMPSRPPSFALRETRPEQGKFRQRVAAKTGNRCALSGAPQEVCDAAHFPWADWRTDNQAHHGVLLRRDLHAALDCGLIEIDRLGRIIVSEYLASMSNDYRALHGREVPVGEIVRN